MNAAVQLTFDGKAVPATAKKARAARPPARTLITRALENAGPLGLLVEEIAKHTHLSVQSVSARIGEMVRAHEVLPTHRRATKTGSMAWAFTVPATYAGDYDAACEARVRANMLARTNGRWKGPVPAVAEVLRATSGEILGT